MIDQITAEAWEQMLRTSLREVPCLKMDANGCIAIIKSAIEKAYDAGYRKGGSEREDDKKLIEQLGVRITQLVQRCQRLERCRETNKHLRKELAATLRLAAATTSGSVSNEFLDQARAAADGGRAVREWLMQESALDAYQVKPEWLTEKDKFVKVREVIE